MYIFPILIRRNSHSQVFSSWHARLFSPAPSARCPLMVDIHCHILPGLDDGPDTLAESLQMAEMAIRDGISHVIATPHANDTYKFIPEMVQKRRDELQARLGDRLQLATGCDFHLSYENLLDLRNRPKKYTLNQKKYLLVEFADFAIPPTIDRTLHEITLTGLRPIITHPERNALIRANPARLADWVRRGCRIQVTALSLLGRFGHSAQEFADWLLARDAIHFIASDAHNVKGRPLLLKEAFDIVTERRGHRVARALFQDNPMAAFEGRPLPYSPDVADLGAPRRKKRKRFWPF
jgi:protein-tyrosine phosphatase